MKPITVGPFGGNTGRAWDDGIYSAIRKLIVYSGVVVDSIQIEYDKNGQSETSERHGTYGPGGASIGGNRHEIDLDYPDEYVTSISGYCSSYVELLIVFSLTIESNKRIFGPFGTERGSRFSVPSTIGKVVGFFGRYSPYVVSIGVYVEPFEPFKTIGPFGGEGGVSWDDGRHISVRSFTIVSESIINSIVIEYDNNGSSLVSTKHGGNGEGRIDTVKLDYLGEFVTSISGYYNANCSPAVIQSLTIKTNRRAYGPFGVERGKYFCLPSKTGAKVIGFHGKSGVCLHSIGVHLEPITSDFYRVHTVGPFGGMNGYSWDDKTHVAIKQIRVVHGSFISSIRFEYLNEDNSSVWSPRHGGDYEPKHDMVQLDFPYEFLTSVAGSFAVDDLNDNMMTSITFHTNRSTYGPYGRKHGKYFSFPSINGKILGFHGKSSGYVYAIGAHIEPISDPIPSELVGAFGGEEAGHIWDDGVYSTVRQLVITCGESLVNSISIEYDRKGQSVWSSKHGESVGDKSYTIKLDYPYEFLTSMSGYYSTSNSDSATIQSLTIQSNKKTYGPFGNWRGNNKFSSLPRNGKIIGFHGTCGDCVHSIGVYLKPIRTTYNYKFMNSYGGQGGNLWDDGAHTTIRQLVIGAGSLIYSIRVEYDDHGCSVWAPRHGETNGGNKYMVKLDYPAEFLISISGYYGSDNHSSTIQSLTIQSNRRNYGPFGTSRGSPFSFPSSGGKIIGFHGRTFPYLRAIGVYMELPESVGPFGGRGGDEWDDGAYSTIRQIKLTVRYFGIESVSFEYDKNGYSVWSEKHGSKGEGNLEKVILDYPSEFLVSVSGTYGKEYGILIVQSLTFRSNKETYGPFGLNKGNHFSLSSGGKIIGFHGRCGFYLDAIGAYVEPT